MWPATRDEGRTIYLYDSGVQFNYIHLKFIALLQMYIVTSRQLATTVYSQMKDLSGLNTVVSRKLHKIKYFAKRTHDLVEHVDIIRIFPQTTSNFDGRNTVGPNRANSPPPGADPLVPPSGGLARRQK